MSKPHKQTSVHQHRYRPAKGSHLSQKDAELLGQTIDNLKARLGRGVTPEDLVSEAQRAGSLIHHLWEWDLHKAAAQAWIERAKYLIRSVVCTVVVRSRPIENVRAFVSVHDSKLDGNGNHARYVTMTQALTDKDLRRELVAQALREFIALREKYAVLNELSQLMQAVDRERRKWKL